MDTVQRAIKMMYKAVGEAKCAALRAILEECTIQQGRLLCEILGCSLTFGFGIKHFLSAFKYPEAVETWVMTSSLKKVAHSICTGERCPMETGYYVASMLARQKPFTTPEEAYAFVCDAAAHDGYKKKRKRKIQQDNDVEKIMELPMFAQIKIDGFRIQVHRAPTDASSSKTRYWYYSRGGLDLGDSYFFNMLNDTLDATCTASEYIVDGEIIAWDSKSGDFVPASDMGSFAWLKDHTIKLMYFVFDVLYIGGKQACINMPYRERLAILNNMFEKTNQDSAMVIPMVPGAKLFDMELCKLVENVTETSEYYGHVIDHDLEGIMLKDPSSLWTPHERTNNHVKVKPSPKAYDLWIVGVNVNRQQLVAAVLLAYKSDDDGELYALCMCGTGLTMRARHALTVFVAESGTWSTKVGRSVPHYLHTIGGVSDRPHMYLKEPISCKVTAQKMTNSKVYAGGKTLRFPVLREIPAVGHGVEVLHGAEVLHGVGHDILQELDFVNVVKESNALEGIRIWIVTCSNTSLMSELYRHVLRLGGRPMIGDVDAVDVIVLPCTDCKLLDKDEMHVVMNNDAFANTPKVNADWIRKTYLWNEVQHYDDFVTHMSTADSTLSHKGTL